MTNKRWFKSTWFLTLMCITIFLWAAIAVIIGVIIDKEDKVRLTDAPETNRFTAKITKVVDGDTMHISYDDRKETIRLLLVDTPETVDPNKEVQPFGPEASKYAHEILDDKDVSIEIDVSERDKYGRLLCYLWIDGKMFNEMLRVKGLARVAYVYPPNIKYVDQYRDTQKGAQLAGMGIWSIENYAREDGFHTETAEGVTPDLTPVPSQKDIETDEDIYYSNCTAVREAGKDPLYERDPGYSKKLDGDKDWVACE